MPTLLVIDDQPAILECFRIGFEAEADVTLLTADSALAGIALFSQHRPDVVCLDINLPDLSGLEAFRRLHGLDPKVPVIFMTGGGTTGTAIEAMALGAYEYLLKPLDFEQTAALVHKAFEISRLMRVPAVVPDEPPGLARRTDATMGAASSQESTADVLVGRCPAMQDVYKSIGRVARQDVTVLILGESGTGKELVARAIYHYSLRANGPFLAVNCAAMPETLVESELFGHEKGAFTGANQKRVGKFEQCSGGTLFLDEIGDMTPLTQAKILRVIQEQQFERVGGNETIRTNVRLIAATNHDLEQLVAAGQFRKDLYYRLNTYTISLPPLRERTEDLPMLIEHFLRLFRQRLGKDVQTVAPEALQLLQRYPWPGNLRELQSVLMQAMLQATGPVLVPDFFPAAIRDEEEAGGVRLSPTSDWDRFIDAGLQRGSTELYTEWLALTDRHLFTRVLRHTKGNLTQASKILGIHPMTLRTKLRALGIKVERASSIVNRQPDEAAESAVSA